MSNPKIDWYGEIAKESKINIMLIKEFMTDLYDKTGRAEFTEVLDKLKVIQLAVSNTMILQTTAPYFMMFKDDILNEDVEKLLNFNYETLIKNGTETETDLLIKTLIKLVKETWITGSAVDRIKIKRNIISLLKCSIKYTDAVKKC